MAWITPTLRQVREIVRDDVSAALRGAVFIGNTVLRVISDSQAALAHLVLRYIDWLARQLLPDTAETEWLDRHAEIWLGGRKAATFAVGTIKVIGVDGIPFPSGTLLTCQSANGAFVLQTTADALASSLGSLVPFVAITPDQTALQVDTDLALKAAIAGIASVTIATINDGVPVETDDELRGRVLARIREPPMGGDAFDYVEWALEFPGVTRVWCSPLEMGIGTVTVRFMMDDLRASSDPLLDGFPFDTDVLALSNFLATKRPVTVKDMFVEAPLPEPINVTISNLSTTNASPQGAIAASVGAMLKNKAAPASSLNGVGQPPQTIYAAWVSQAISATEGVDYFDLDTPDHTMPNNGAMAVLGTITIIS